VAVGSSSWSNASYRAVGSLTTTDFVGTPHAGGERAVAAALTVTGGLFYLVLLGSVAAVVVRTAATEEFRARTRRKAIERLNGHFIVCGYGRIGRSVTRLLRTEGADVVVIDRVADKADEIRGLGAHFIAGEADEEGTLSQAEPGRARALIACVGSDADNVYIALAARRCRPDLVVVARASDDEAKKNLDMAKGQFLNEVISPYESASRGLVDCVRGLAT
jgi:voltage-gated potassium channel